ncbi:hypothetical protein MMC13_006931 [Lambiella insularis]|nr:hypothetical protein [Lambiella insularis]
MVGVPIYTESPISPQKSAYTPRTTRTPSPYEPIQEETASSESPVAASTTSAYTPAYPSGLPTPTQPTAFTASSTNAAPPPPQPGALPTPFVPKSRTPSPRREIPPPPKVGEKVKPASYYSPAPTPTYFAAPQPFPSNLGFSAAADPQSARLPPASATTPNIPSLNGYSNGYSNGYTNSYANNYTTANGLLSPQSARLPYGQTGTNSSSPAQTPTTSRSFDHPTGYVQNPYAADMTPEQRFGTAHSPHSPTLGWNTSNAGKSPGIFGSGVGLGGLTSPVGGLGGGLGGILNGGGGEAEESVWGMVGGWVKGVGKKVGEVEGEVWRRINGD